MTLISCRIAIGARDSSHHIIGWAYLTARSFPLVSLGADALQFVPVRDVQVALSLGSSVSRLSCKHVQRPLTFACGHARHQYYNGLLESSRCLSDLITFVNCPPHPLGKVVDSGLDEFSCFFADDDGLEVEHGNLFESHLKANSTFSVGIAYNFVHELSRRKVRQSITTEDASRGMLPSPSRRRSFTPSGCHL